jgi:hypothetical protein
LLQFGSQSIGAFLYYTVTLLLPCIIILFLHLLSINHKCIQYCYFSLLYKPVVQKLKMDSNSSMGEFYVLRCPGYYSCIVLEPSIVLLRKRVILLFRDIIYVIIIFYSWYLTIYEHFISVCGINDHGHHAMSTWFYSQNRVWQKLHPIWLY